MGLWATWLQSLMPWGLNESGWALFSLGVGCTLVLLNFSHLTKYLSVDTTVVSCCLFILFSSFFFLIFKLLLYAWELCTGCSHTYLTERMQLAVVLLGCRRTWTCTWPHIFFKEGLTEPNPGAHQGEQSPWDFSWLIQRSWYLAENFNTSLVLNSLCLRCLSVSV